MKAIKQKRLEIIQKQRTTVSTKDGVVAVDDTRGPKSFAKKTQGTKWSFRYDWVRKFIIKLKWI